MRDQPKAISMHRGHEMVERNGVFYYADNDLPVAENGHRPCGKCGKFNTPDDHDACLGTIHGPVMNACCGHGETRCAYIQFTDGSRISGQAVFDHLKIMTQYEEPEIC